MALSEFFERQQEYQASPSAVRKRAMWAARGNRYLSASGGLRRSDLVQPDPDLNRKLTALTEQAFPVVSRAFNDHFGPMAVEAFDLWPVASGLSKSLLDLEYEIEGDALVGSLVNRAPYAYYIREGQKGRERSRRPRSFLPEEVAMMDRAPKGVSRKEWKQAIAVGAKQVDLVSYGYAVGVLKNIQKAQSKKRRPKKGRRIADALVFRPGLDAATKMESQIAGGIK